MMKIPKILLLSFMLLLVFNVSCKKDKEPEDCVISTLKITETEGTSSKSDLYNFIHNDSDGLVEYGSGNFAARFVYNQDKKVERIELLVSGVLEEYAEIIWSDNARDFTIVYHQKEGGVFVAPDFKIEIRHNANNELIESDEFYLYDGVWYLFYYSDYTWSGGNVIKVEEYEYPGKSSMITKRHLMMPRLRDRVISDFIPRGENVSKSTSEFVKVFTLDFTYDNKKNPFQPHQALGVFLSHPLFISTNNVLTVNEVDHFEVVEYQSNFIYEYNSLNFPLKRSTSATGWSLVWEMGYVCE